MAQIKVLFATFPYGNWLHPDVSEWLIKTIPAAKSDPRISEVWSQRVADTPITMTRNRVLKHAMQDGIDYVVMVDSDMSPDNLLDQPGAKPFFSSSLDFALELGRPCIIAAPYGGPPPHENMYVFRWNNIQSDHPDCDMQLDQYGRSEASIRGGIEEVGALPTGVCMIDVRVAKLMPAPWFDYEYKDPPYNTEKGSTEDVFFTRNASLMGIPVFCNWDAWAGHWKPKCVSKPLLLTADKVRDTFKEAILSGRKPNEKLVTVNFTVPPPTSLGQKLKAERSNRLPVIVNGVNGHTPEKAKKPARKR